MISMQLVGIQVHLIESVYCMILWVAALAYLGYYDMR